MSDAAAASAPRRTHPHGWSVPAGRVAGIDLRVHASFLLLVALFAWAAPRPGLAAAAESVAWLVAIFACVVVHELAHCFVARTRGAQVDEILLFPLGGVSRLRHLPENPRDEFAIAIAGPLTSIGLGLAAALIGFAARQPLVPIDFVTGSWIVRLAWLNLVLGAFNLLPAFPLDGGRVLRSLLERNRDLEAATHVAAHVGRVLAVVMMAVGLFVDVWLTLIGIFVYFGASAEEAGTIVHARLHGHRVREAMEATPDAATGCDLVVEADDFLEDDLVEDLTAARGRCAAVRDGGAIVGVLHLEDLGRLVATGRSAPTGPKR